MGKSAPSLRSVFAAITILLAILVFVVSGSLVALTTQLHRTSVAVGTAFESIFLAEEAAKELFRHELAVGAESRTEIESKLRQKVRATIVLSSSAQEQEVVGAAITAVESYLAAATAEEPDADDVAARVAEAHRALEALVAVELAEAADARAQADRWDHVANVLGIGTAAFVVLLAGTILWWLAVGAFRPMFALTEAMERLGRGDRSVRAGGTGSREFREIATRFNEMVDALAVQRRGLMAVLAGVAHDFRNPLSALKMSALLLQRNESFTDGDGSLVAVEAIHRQVACLERLLEDFVDVARLEAGRLALRLEVHDARTILRDTVRTFASLASGHRIELRLPDAPMPFWCDRARIEQVFTNLLSNAIKYSPEGSVVEIVAETSAVETSVSVVDHGLGISIEDQRQLFEPFCRVGPWRDAVQGTGLGLFVVRRLVEAHGGRVDVESEPSRGSTFRVRLPLRPETAIAALASEQAQPAA